MRTIFAVCAFLYALLFSLAAIIYGLVMWLYRREFLNDEKVWSALVITGGAAVATWLLGWWLWSS